MKYVIEIIHNLLNKLLISDDNYVFLDKNNTINYYYNNNLYNIKIIHNLNYIHLLTLINNLNSKNFKLVKNTINYNNIVFLYKDETSEYNFSLIKEKIKYEDETQNIYFDIMKSSYILYYDNNRKYYIKDNVELEDKICKKYYNFRLDDNIYNLVELIIFYFKNNKKFKGDIVKITKIIDETNFMLKLKNKLRTTIKKDIEKDYTNNINKLILLIKELYKEFNELIKYDIINYIFFDVNTKVSTYNININNIEEYLIFILLEKYNIIKEELLNNDLNDLNDYDDYDDFNNCYNENMDLLIDKDTLIDLKNIKESISFIKNINIFESKVELINKIVIKNYITILSILFHIPKKFNNFNHNRYKIDIKMAYIYKLYQNIDKNTLKEIFIFYNKIMVNLQINNFYIIRENDYIYKMIDNKTIKEFENNKLLSIPEVSKKFNEKTDNISIIDYQNAIIILYEYIYNENLNDDNLNNIEYLDELFDSIITSIKSNKISKNINKIARSCRIDFNNILLNNNHENNENNENDENDGDDEDNNDKYKNKYIKYKNNFLILKKVKETLLNKDFDKNILNNYDELDDELIEIIMDKYNN
jgi:hypothetical protein